MFHVGVNWWSRMQRAAWALSAVALPLVLLGGSVADAQSLMRTPTLRLNSRTPTIAVNPTTTSRINPAISGAASTANGGRVNTITVNRPSNVAIANRPTNIGI